MADFVCLNIVKVGFLVGIMPTQCSHRLILDRGELGGGLLGLSPPGPVKSIDFRGFHAPTGAEPPPGKKKM